MSDITNGKERNTKSEEYDDEKEESDFKKFLNKVENCLSGRSRATGLTQKSKIGINMVSDEYDQHFGRLVNNKSQDETRCFEIVRRVLDEETVLEMVSSFLMLTQEHRVPSTARIDFHSCNFDPISGVHFN